MGLEFVPYARPCLSAIFPGLRLGHRRSALGFLCSSDRSIPPKDDSGTIRVASRRALLVALATAVGAAKEAGDRELAELATVALRALLDSASV